MIPVRQALEPDGFDAAVRRPGMKWLADRNVPPLTVLPSGDVLPTHWRKSLKDLHAAYGGICAYLAVYIERCIGAVSTDHFVAKSKALLQAYEWGNYRLACTAVNGCKGDFALALDPFLLAPDTFHLELVSGRIFVNPLLDAEASEQADTTIVRLKLDSQLCREMRARRFGEFCQREITSAFLRRYAPFVWHEANRQGLL